MKQNQVFYLSQLLFSLNFEERQRLLGMEHILDKKLIKFLSNIFSKTFKNSDELYKFILILKDDVLNQELIYFIECYTLSIKSNRSDLYLKLSYTFKEKSNEFNYFIEKLEKSLEEEEIRYPELYVYQEHIHSMNVYGNQIEPSLSSNTYLLEHYLLKKMYLLVYILSDNHIFKRNIEDIKSEFNVLKNLMSISNISSKELEAFSLVIDLMLENEKETYTQLLNILNHKDLQLTNNSIQKLYLLIINTAYINLKNWDLNLNDILNIYLSLHQNYSVAFYKYIQPQVIKNIFTLSVRANKLDIIDSIFSKDKIKVMDDECIEAIELGKVKLLYHESKFSDCIAHLNQFKFKNIFQELELRRLQLMCFYELKERVLVDNYANTFKIFIYRNKEIQTIYKESNNNFIRFINRINKTIDLSRLNTIQEEINKTERISEKQWLIDKVKELNIKLSQIH